jgi:hypothetical protein
MMYSSQGWDTEPDEVKSRAQQMLNMADDMGLLFQIRDDFLNLKSKITDEVSRTLLSLMFSWLSFHHEHIW